MIKWLVFSIFALFVTITNAQKSVENSFLFNKGPIPDEFVSTKPLMLQLDLIGGNADSTSSFERSRKKFAFYSDYYIKQLLTSGDLLYGDETTMFLNRVVGKLLKNFPDIKKQLRFYVALYPEVNAVCLPNGIIIINIGLLAKLENEAQLAYVIAHEMVHYINRHGVDSFIEGQKIRRKKGDYRSCKNYERVFAMLSYSRELELEADQQGLMNYFSQSAYSLAGAESLFDILLNSENPVENVPFTRDIIEDEWFAVPDKYWPAKTDSVTSGDEFSEIYSTHPNIKTRKEMFRSNVMNMNEAGVLFQLPESEFYSMRERARFELCHLYMQEKRFVDAIYLIHILQQNYPQNEYLNNAKACSYFNILKIASFKSKSGLLDRRKKSKGEIQRLYELIENCTDFQLAVISFREIWKIHKLMPDNSVISEMTHSACRILLKMQDFTPGYFRLTEPRIFDTDTLSADSITKMTKYEVLKQRQKRFFERDRFTLAFLDFLKDEDFIAFYNDALDTAKNIRKYELKYLGKMKRLEKRTDDEYERWDCFKAFNMPEIKKIIVFDPMGINLSWNFSESDNVLENKAFSRMFKDALMGLPAETKINYEIIDVEALSAGDNEKYNDHQSLSRWNNELDEKLFADNFSCVQDQLDEIAIKYETPYVLRTGFVTVKAPPGTFESNLVMLSVVLCPFLIPGFFAYAVLHRVTYYYFDVYDISFNELVYSESVVVEMKPTMELFKLMLNNSFNNLK